MREKRHKERSKAPLPLLTYQAEEILVAKNRAVSPLVLSFIYEPENIALRDLGTLFGTFIVTDHHEDSSYIVNCLAAAAKKEYFINPRRSVEESFESTLHKINLTLGKLVRDGHINWMGKFHGSIIAIRDREAYFSVTGLATILLLRHTTLSAISEGLADPEAALHPLKTFTDIAEGKLLADDKIIVSTPELLELLPHALLEREAGKLPIDRLAQLMRTALINERSAAATILINFSENPAKDTRGALRMTPKSDDDSGTPVTPLIENIFSSQPFHKEQKSHPAEDPVVPPADTGEKEHIDNRTGHIYIQADTTTPRTITETAIDRGIMILKEQCLILFIKGKKNILRYSALLSEGISSFVTRCFQWLMRFLRRLATLLSRYLRSALDFLITASRDLFPRKTSFINISFNKKNTPTPGSPSPAAPAHLPVSRASVFRTFARFHFHFPSSWFPLSRPAILYTDRIGTSIRKLCQGIISLFQYRSTRQKWLMGIAICLILTGTMLVMLSPTPEEIQEEGLVVATPPPTEPTFPPTDEPLARAISGNEIMSFNTDEAPLIPLVLKDALFILTDRSIINGETKTSIPLPASATPVLLASAMRDLNAIFIYGADKKMYIFYPNAKSAVENTFPLPNDFALSDMGTYLTYLYAFDAKQGRILRFPRAEGGFGTPTEWLKEKTSFGENAKISIGESILIGSDGTISSFTKGKGGALPLTGTRAPVAIRDIALAGDGSFVILDTTEKRIVHFSANGQLIGQIFDAKLENANHLAILSNGSTAFVTTPDKILSFEIP